LKSDLFKKTNEGMKLNLSILENKKERLPRWIIRFACKWLTEG